MKLLASFFSDQVYVFRDIVIGESGRVLFQGLESQVEVEADSDILEVEVRFGKFLGCVATFPASELE